MTSSSAEPPLPHSPLGRRPGRRGTFRVPAVRIARSTIGLLFVSILLPLALFALAAAENHRDVERAAELRVDRTTRILHEHALKVFETHQLMIDQINERVHETDWSDPKSVSGLHDLLGHLQAVLPQVAAIVVTDADGRLRASSLGFPADRSVSVADRDYFQALKAGDQKLPYVSRTVIGRMTGDLVFNMAARIQGAPGGRFDGIISISVEQQYFDDFYRDTEREFEHRIILARNDGAVLASEPPLSTSELGADALFRMAWENAPAKGTTRPAVIRGERRIFGYEKVGDYPVYIGFGLSWRSAMLPWWRNMRGYGLVAGLSSLALLAVSGFAIRRATLEGQATKRWRRSAALLETEIAERARVEEQLRHAQKLEAVGRLTGGIAHDFNNLLTVVIGSLDLLSRRMKEADPRHQALVKNAVDGASRAAALTSRLLAFSRQQPLDPKPLDINALISDMTGLLERTLGENVAIQCQLAPDVDQVFADPSQLENAIINLCVNAMDAMPKGGTLTIATANAHLGGATDIAHPELSDGDYVTISVIDTGSGMKPEVLGRAFEPFYTTKPVGKGTGLGLSQVYGFARQSDGDVTIQSELGRGTTIVIALPRSKTTSPALHEPLPVPEIASTARVSGRGATILLVEDEELVRSFSSGALRDAGYRVVEAGTGPDGLARLRETPDVALLFTDVVLKGPMNGQELAEAAEALRPGLPVLFTTGYTKDAIVHDGRLKEGLNFIGKPFTTAALVAKIEELLDLPVPQVRHRATG